MGRDVKYPPLEERLRLEQEAEARKAENATKAAEAKAARAERTEKRDVQDGLGLGAALQRVAEKQGEIEVARENHTAAVAEYLKPYLKKLNALERSMRPFPSNVQIPWADVESDVLDPTSPENIREIGDRYGIDRKALYDMSKKRKWTKRRAIVMELHSRTSTVKALANSTHAMVGGSGDPGASIVEDEELLVGLVKECLNQINTSLAAGLIPFRSAGDVDKIVRLLLVVQGKADSIREHRDQMTPAQMETLAAKVAKNLKVDAALAGIVVPTQDAEFEVLDEEPEPAAIEHSAAP
jgi:hypothetical protein